MEIRMSNSFFKRESKPGLAMRDKLEIFTNAVSLSLPSFFKKAVLKCG